MDHPPFDMPPGGYLSDFLVYCAIWLVLVSVSWWYFRIRAKERRRILVGNLLVFALLGWTPITLGEAYYRYVYDATDSYGLTVTNWCWMTKHCRDLNSMGYRMGEIRRDGDVPRVPEGVTRVAFVGDSFTFGYGVPNEADLFPQRIEAALRTRDRDGWEVWNLGGIGLQTPQEADLIEKFVPDPSASHIVLAYCLNDIEDLLPRKQRFFRDEVERITFIKPWQSFLLDTLWFRLRLRGDARISGYFEWVQEAYSDGTIWDLQKRRFQRISEHCAQHGVKLSVVVFPFFGAWGDDYPFDAAHEQVGKGWRDLGVETIDLRAVYRGHAADDLVVNSFDAHPNEWAHEIAADEILKQLFPSK